MLVMEGVKVVDASQWVMGPSAAVILADWGADVIRIEHPIIGEPLRGTLSSMGYDTTFDFYIEQNNHSKRSVGVDLASPAGRDVFLELIAASDVLITSFLEPARQKWRITYEDLREVNPRLVYARTHGQGPRGPEAYAPGYDATSYWARGGVGFMATPEGGRARPMPAGGFGDVQGGLALAAGVAAALFRRSQTGEGGLVDVSLLGVGLWDMYEVIQVADVYGIDPKRDFKPGVIPINPLSGVYETADDRDIALCMVQPDPFWPGFCGALGWEHLVDDVRFHTFEARAANYDELAGLIRDHFRLHSMDDLCKRLLQFGCAFSAFKTPAEVPDDVQVQANGYLMPHPSVPDRFIVSSPVQFDGVPLSVKAPAASAGQHTEEVLLELGYSWEQIGDLKDQGAVT
jgi:crotonobetainyl-CoA:carnitine CoA-transferase CaiB-like acyl-CoA transferase